MNCVLTPDVAPKRGCLLNRETLNNTVPPPVAGFDMFSDVRGTLVICTTNEVICSSTKYCIGNPLALYSLLPNYIDIV